MDGKSIEVICEEKLEYLFLVSLISSDNILAIEDAENSLKRIDEVEEALKDAKISKEKKKEFMEYINKGRDILKSDIERFKK